MTKNEKQKTKRKNKVLTLVLKDNQDGISKSNTAPQLVGTKIIGMNSKDHPESKVNRKQLVQLKKYFSSFIKIESNYEKNKELHYRSNLIYSQA